PAPPLARGRDRRAAAPGPAAPSPRARQERLRKVRADGRQDRLGVELNTVNRQLTVAYGHHLSFGARGRDFQAIGDRGCRERMVTACLERVGEAAEEAPAVVVDHARLAVHKLLRLTDLAAEGLDDRLVAETDAEDWHSRRQPPHDLYARAGARR